MLLGLMAAALLATLLQLHALRARRTPAYDCGGDGVIHLRCWTVVETAPIACLATARMLALPAPAPRPQPLTFVGDVLMLRPPARVRPPRRARPTIHAAAERARPSNVTLPPDVLIRVFPAEPAWPPHSRAPPGYVRAVPARPALLN